MGVVKSHLLVLTCLWLQQHQAPSSPAPTPATTRASSCYSFSGSSATVAMAMAPGFAATVLETVTHKEIKALSANLEQSNVSNKAPNM